MAITRKVAPIILLAVCTVLLLVLYEGRLFHNATTRPVVLGHDVIPAETLTSSNNDVYSPEINQSDVAERKNFIGHILIGRLGNVLFQYASLYCVAKLNHLQPFFYFTEETDVNFFRNPGSSVAKSMLMQASQKVIHERYCCSFDQKFFRLSPDRNYTAFGYFQSWKYFEPCKEELEEVLIFQEEFIRKAEDTISSLRVAFPGQVLVGIHIRMEDHTHETAVRNGKRIATPDYFQRAMDYFRRRFPARFIVITSETSWWQHYVSQSPDVTLLTRSEPPTDMELLSRMDHLIISVGTFGWWAAYRCRGTVVCAEDFFTPGTHYARQFQNNATDYFYPGWIRM